MPYEISNEKMYTTIGGDSQVSSTTTQNHPMQAISLGTTFASNLSFNSNAVCNLSFADTRNINISNNEYNNNCNSSNNSNSTTNSNAKVCICATVSFMDIKSASKAHQAEHKLDDRILTTKYYEPSSVNVVVDVMQSGFVTDNINDMKNSAANSVLLNSSRANVAINNNSNNSNNNNSNINRQSVNLSSVSSLPQYSSNVPGEISLRSSSISHGFVHTTIKQTC